MTKVQIREEIDAPAADVWDCFMGSRAEELAIGVYAESIVTEGSGPGMVRISQLLGGRGEIRERLDVLEPENFYCRYSLIQPGPLPFRNYVGQMQVEPLGERKSPVTLQAEFEPVGMSEEEAVAAYRLNNLTGLAKVKSFLGLA